MKIKANELQHAVRTLAGEGSTLYCGSSPVGARFYASVRDRAGKLVHVGVGSTPSKPLVALIRAAEARRQEKER